MAKQITFEINANTKVAVKSLGDLEKAIEQLKKELKGADLGSAKFKRLSRQLQNAQSEAKALEKTFEGLEPEKKIEAFTKVGEALAGGFAAATGTMALFEKESEAVNKFAEKSQQAVAVALGLRAVAEGAVQASIAKRLVVEGASALATKTLIGLQSAYNVVVGVGSNAMKIFRLALASTGIGALVVGLGLLISNFDKVSGFVKTFIDKFATLRIAVDALTKAWTWLSEAIGLSDTAEEKAAARAEIRKKNSDIRVKQMEREIALLKAQGATEEEIYNKQVQIYRDRIKAETELYNAKRKTGTATREEYEALQDLGNEYAVFIAERQTKLKEEREKELQAQKDKNDKLREEQKKYLTDINNQLTDAKIRNINDSVQREIEAERVALQRKLQAIKGNSASEVALREQLQIESQNKINKIVEDDAKAKSDKEKEERAKEIETSYRDKIASIEASILAGQEGSLSLLNAERELALQQRNQALESDTLTSGERLKIEQEYQNRLLELSKAQQDFEAQLAQQKRDAVVNAAQSTLNALTVIGNLANQNAEKQSAFQKAVAVAGLAINTAQAIGSTIAGATAAAATAGPAFPFVLAGYIASGLATVLTNFATAKKLLGGAGASVNASGASGGGGVQGGTPTNIQTTPNQQVDAKSDINVKAFVVESDMTNAQKQAQKAKQLSEF